MLHMWCTELTFPSIKRHSLSTICLSACPSVCVCARVCQKECMGSEGTASWDFALLLPCGFQAQMQTDPQAGETVLSPGSHLVSPLGKTASASMSVKAVLVLVSWWWFCQSRFLVLAVVLGDGLIFYVCRNQWVVGPFLKDDIWNSQHALFQMAKDRFWLLDILCVDYFKIWATV